MINFFKQLKLDAEYRELINSHNQVKQDASLIRDYLIKVLDDAQNDIPKFGDDRLLEARQLIEQVGPGAFYWMCDIAAQMVLLASAKFNEIPTSVDAALQAPVRPIDILKEVVRV